MAAFQHRTAGESIRHYAAETNAFIDAAQAHRLRERTTKTPPPTQLPPGIVYIKNNSGAARSDGDVLALSAPIFTDGDKPGFVGPPAFVGVTPTPETNPAHRSRIAILIGPLAAGAVGRARIAGQTTLTIDVIDAAHTRARVLDDHSLQSGYFGPVRILASETGAADPTATRCIVDIDSHDAGHCLAKVPEAGLAGGTWASPSTTSCIIAWPHPTTKAATDVPSPRPRNINVVHWGPAIAYESGKYTQCRILGGLIIPDVEYCDG